MKPTIKESSKNRTDYKPLSEERLFPGPGEIALWTEPLSPMPRIGLVQKI